jgi:NDP-sugar pyrophosphorylase family protein/mannose-6-phosphate isomerase-like protein (cupin superfamily)
MNEDIKVVHKPWGKEVWLELNNKYCYKRIYINKGTRTSFQYHEKKLETNYIISGTAEVWLENDNGEIEKTIMKENSFFTVTPPKKHRVIALTDLVLQEVSTPEVDDVIRIQDDCLRGDGRLEHEHSNYAACILTAGTGRRMGQLSDLINKALLPVNNKAIISHMIEKIPKDYDIVVALGFKKEMVKEYCLAAHPDRAFIFVDVGPYSGPDTGPSYSISRCREHLERPFYFMTSDCFIEEELPKLTNNWLGVSQTSIPELYSTVKVDDNKVTCFKNKGLNGYENAFIGIASIYDFETFWNELNIDSGEIVSAFYNIENYQSFYSENLTWYDTGTIDNYLKARDKFQQDSQMGILKTNGEFVYKVGDRFIKISNNKQSIKKKIYRQKKIIDYTPELNFKGDYIFSYDFVNGKTLYELDNLHTFKKFLDYAEKNLWSTPEVFENTNAVKKQCLKFYKDKTLQRLKKFMDSRDSFFEKEHVVNGKPTKTIKHIINNFDWNSVCEEAIPTSLFHGDLQFDNIIYSENNKFVLIDWRHEFGTTSDFGDIYYDLSKLYGGCLLSYSLLKNENNFSLKIHNHVVELFSETTRNLSDFLTYYENWITKNGYELSKVKKITSLIYLNMAPLHSQEFGNFLFFKFKEMSEAIDN